MHIGIGKICLPKKVHYLKKKIVLNAYVSKLSAGCTTTTFLNSGIIYIFQKMPFLTLFYFDSISGNGFLQIIADPKYPTRCAWHPPSSMTGVHPASCWKQLADSEHWCSDVRYLVFISLCTFLWWFPWTFHGCNQEQLLVFKALQVSHARRGVSGTSSRVFRICYNL